MSNRYTSITTLSSAANFMFRSKSSVALTFRTYIKPREFGKLKLKFWHSNNVDSTWSDGSESNANDAGGAWRIEACFIADGGLEANGSVVQHSEQAIYFDGETSRNVLPGEQFWSDEVSLTIPNDHFLAFTWTIMLDDETAGLPYNTETLLASAFEAIGNYASEPSATPFAAAGNRQVLPSLLAYEKDISKLVVFLGDSITQGVRTEQDAYAFWAAKIADGLGVQVGVWNIGSGWGRAYDLVNDSSWLSKAKQGDEVIICLGVNDIGTGNRSSEQLIQDLTTIIEQLMQNNPHTVIILCTLPAFNFSGEHEQIWSTVNNWIIHQTPSSVSRVFDIANVLSEPAPNEQLIKPEYMSSNDDPHPNGAAGTAVADVFLEWYKSNN